ncbi:hypothetical protein GW17_00013048 [Ensete ventricosum]|nr:hypothetical protein GW17_00013048 [Ensete ventricosum]
MRTARYRVVPLKIDRRWSIEGEIDCRRSIDGEIDCRRSIEEDKGKKKEEKKRRKNIASSSFACRHRRRAVVAGGRGRIVAARALGRFFSCISPRGEKGRGDEMTLEEYEKIKEEKRKALLAMKSEERKVEIDKELQSMQQLSTKKENDPIFVKLVCFFFFGSDKDSGKKKENIDRDERSKKALSINEFLKPAEGERYYGPSGRGRGRGRGDRGPLRASYGSGVSSFAAAAPSIEDPGQFPTLGGK